ncbi:MAG: HAMP domain-containing protein [Anaerolineales bacterium]|nr:HAMP domain-containing protein [Anaerolineales bacterium]MCA9976133.1 HAMP domain-containing protein [Anaerolineales bacterium]MCB8965446.1 HAMP domain-containing protein [Ardenticatenaceae bacterium]
MQRPLRQSGITQKFIGYLIFLSILPVIIVGLTSFQTSRSLLQQEANRYTMALVENQRDYLDLQLDQIESLVANVSGVEEIRRALEVTEDTTNTYIDLNTQAQIGYILSGYSNLRGLVSIDIFTVYGSHYHVGDTLNIDNIRQDVHDTLFQRALESDQFVTWAGIEDNVNANSTHTKVVTAAKILQNTDRLTLQQKPIALILVNYSVEALSAHFQQVDLGENAYLMVLDGENRILYHPDLRLLGQPVSASFAHLFTDTKDTLVQEVDGQVYSLNYVRSPKSGWVVLGLVPLQTLADKTSSIGRTTFVVMLFCFSVVGLVAFVYNTNVVLPIRTITNRFKQLQETPLEKQVALPVRGNDEIAELVQWFNAFQSSLLAKQEAEAQIQASLAEKEVLLKEIHHRVKNNLQIISSLLNLQMERLNDSYTTSVFEDSKNRVRSMALIHEKLYQSQNLARIDFAEYVANLTHYLARTYHADQIRLQLSLEQVYLGIDTAVPCGLILNELVSNAFKHAFTHQQSGHVCIKLRQNEAAQVTLAVGDDGVGLPADFDSSHVDSLGLQLVHNLTKQLGGTLTILDHDDDFALVTIFKLTFSVPTEREGLS